MPHSETNPKRDRHSSAPGPVKPQLISEFAADADMVELIEYFMTELDHRITAMERALQEDNRSELYTLAHQLKGAASGFGYPSITERAAALEASLRSDEAELSAIAEKAEALIDLCRQAAGTSGAPGPGKG